MSLRAVTTRDLERLLRDVRRGAVRAPLTRTSLIAAQLGHVASPLSVLDGLDAKAVEVVLDAALAERAAAASGAKVTLVWTGPEGKSGWSEPTGLVVRDLFEKAKKSVLIAGYSFDHGASIFDPLHLAMSARDVETSLFLHVDRAPRGTTDVKAWVDGALQTFLAKNWPFGRPYPTLYYDPRTAAPGSVESLHAKCIVVDDRIALLGSANFTDRGQTRNVEVGAVIEDEGFAKALARQWRAAAAAGVFVMWGGGP